MKLFSSLDINYLNITVCSEDRNSRERESKAFECIVLKMKQFRCKTSMPKIRLHPLSRPSPTHIFSAERVSRKINLHKYAV